jgi:hypothetical protein
MQETMLARAHTHTRCVNNRCAVRPTRMGFASCANSSCESSTGTMPRISGKSCRQEKLFLKHSRNRQFNSIKHSALYRNKVTTPCAPVSSRQTFLLSSTTIFFRFRASSKAPGLRPADGRPYCNRGLRAMSHCNRGLRAMSHCRKFPRQKCRWKRNGAKRKVQGLQAAGS